MSINEAGNRRSAPEIDNAGVPAARCADLRFRSGCRDSTIGYRRSIRDWPSAVQGMDAAIEDQRISNGA